MLDELSAWFQIYGLLTGEVVYRANLGPAYFERLGLTDDELFFIEWIGKTLERERIELQKERMEHGRQGR